MKWSDHAWLAIEEIYDSIQNMPFITELANGSLPKEKFQFYIMQDSLYLEHFARALALIGARTYDTRDALSYIRFAENALVVEDALHESYFKDFGVDSKGAIQPACHHYIHFLRSTAALDAVEIGMAATLPCFWIYKKIGDHIYLHQRSGDNPYQRWIETYGGEEFGLAVEQAISICDKAAEGTTADIRMKMTEAFISSSRLEYLFWDGAYAVRTW